MTEFERTAEGLIKVPGYEAEGRRQREQEAALEQMRGWLEEQHREVLEKDPLAPFVFRLPREMLGYLPADKLELLEAFERQTHARLRTVALAKDGKKRAYVAAGGDPATFEGRWALEGEDALLESRAAELERRAAASSPYN